MITFFNGIYATSIMTRQSLPINYTTGTMEKISLREKERGPRKTSQDASGDEIAMNDYFLSRLARQREKEILEEVRGIRLPRRRHLPRGRDVQERASDTEHP
jgi:hypothetical protein